MQPAAGVGAKVGLQQFQRCRGQFADGVDVEQLKFGVGFGTNSVDFFGWQGPDAAMHLIPTQERDAIGLVQVRANFGQELVG